jgi:CheY-like chemotaxis protein
MPHCDRTVLVVDDDVNFREILKQILSLEGYRVTSAATGAEALEVLQGVSSPCVILLDLMMPVMDGSQFRREQARDPALAEIPVVVVSAASNVPQKAAALGAAGYIQKPVDLDNLLSTVQRYCA